MPGYVRWKRQLHLTSKKVRSLTPEQQHFWRILHEMADYKVFPGLLCDESLDPICDIDVVNYLDRQWVSDRKWRFLRRVLIGKGLLCEVETDGLVFLYIVGYHHQQDHCGGGKWYKFVDRQQADWASSPKTQRHYKLLYALADKGVLSPELCNELREVRASKEEWDGTDDQGKTPKSKPQGGQETAPTPSPKPSPDPSLNPSLNPSPKPSPMSDTRARAHEVPKPDSLNPKKKSQARDARTRARDGQRADLNLSLTQATSSSKSDGVDELVNAIVADLETAKFPASKRTVAMLTDMAYRFPAKADLQADVRRWCKERMAEGRIPKRARYVTRDLQRWLEQARPP